MNHFCIAHLIGTGWQVVPCESNGSPWLTPVPPLVAIVLRDRVFADRTEAERALTLWILARTA